MEIHMYFNGQAVFEQIITPSLQQQGFSVVDSYLQRPDGLCKDAPSPGTGQNL